MELEKLKNDIEKLKSNPDTMYKGTTFASQYDELIKKFEYLQMEVQETITHK